MSTQCLTCAQGNHCRQDCHPHCPCQGAGHKGIACLLHPEGCGGDAG